MHVTAASEQLHGSISAAPEVSKVGMFRLLSCRPTALNSICPNPPSISIPSFQCACPTLWRFVEVEFDTVVVLEMLRSASVLTKVRLTLLVMNWLSKRLIRAVRRCAKEIRRISPGIPPARLCGNRPNYVPLAARSETLFWRHQPHLTL